MTKRDDDSQADMEVGMTTAERRRRRRRGGGLRVPSDNVPRRSTTPPVVAPVPEDPSLAMSIAYSFTSDASEPIPRVVADSPSQPIPTSIPSFADPMAPDTMSTVIDPPSQPVESADFEMKTREMSAVDLEALGLTEPGARSSQPRIPMPRVQTDPSPMRSIEVDVDMGAFDGGDAGPTLDSDPPNPHAQAGHAGQSGQPLSEPGMRPPASARQATEPSIAPPNVPASEPSGSLPASVARPPSQRAHTEPGESAAPPPPPAISRVQSRERLRTVALSDEDLEEVREAYRAATQSAPSPGPAPNPTPASSQPLAGTAPSISTTQPLTALDVDVQIEEKPESLAEIDINELAMRADSSGEFEVDVDEHPLKAVPQAAAVTPPPPSPSPDRKRPPSVPPPFSNAKADTHPASVPPPFTGKEAKVDPGAVVPVSHAQTQHPGHSPHSGPHAAPPPPPPAHKAPPAPPPKTKPTPPTAAATQSKIEGKGSRGKPWFVDLFDEDYLRTLPFLTPQATQSEAEFVIEAMGLSPGAQVLDIGCGYGRHAMELAARGFHVVGLDLSTPLLVRGGEEAMRRGLEINFVRGDMRELDFDAQFDGAYCMFSTFGYFDDETNKKTVSNIARALKPGGRVMIEILNRDYVIADLPTRVWWEGEGCVVLEEVELNYFSSRIQVNRSVVFDDGRQLEQEISVRAYSLHEVGKLMHAAGFRVLEVSGGYHTRGRFFGNQSRHIIVLAERKDPAST